MSVIQADVTWPLAQAKLLTQQQGLEKSCILSACQEAMGNMLQPLTHPSAWQASEAASPTVRSLSKKVQPYWQSTYKYLSPKRCLVPGAAHQCGVQSGQPVRQG